MRIVRTLKEGVRIIMVLACQVLLARIAPWLPALRLPEWAGCQYSFSQFGEDRIILEILRQANSSAPGIYVDVGAHHPIVFSNTFLLHKLGWCGVNIDASEECIRSFQVHRPNDRNVWAAVSGVARDVIYYRYPTTLCNQILEPKETKLANLMGEAPLESVPMTTRTLNEILAEVIRPDEKIGFLNIDCEGEDLAILRHLDWDQWRPYIVAVEAHGAMITDITITEMTLRGYLLVGKMLITLVFRDTLAKPNIQTHVEE